MNAVALLRQDLSLWLCSLQQLQLDLEMSALACHHHILSNHLQLLTMQMSMSQIAIISCLPALWKVSEAGGMQVIAHCMLQALRQPSGKPYCKVLGVSASASRADIRRAYRKLAGKWHPDKWQSHGKDKQDVAAEHFAQISEAYTALSQA